MFSLLRFNSIKCNIKWRMPQYINLFPVCKFVGAALQHSRVKQNATRICSTYTTALNPWAAFFSPAVYFPFLLEKSHSWFWLVSSFNELTYWLVFDSGNDKVNNIQSSLKALQMHRIKNSIIKCGCTLESEIRDFRDCFPCWQHFNFLKNRLKVSATV